MASDSTCSLPTFNPNLTALLHQVNFKSISNQTIDKSDVASKKKPEDLSFEEAMKQLEVLVEAMEHGDMPLEQSLESFEKGIKLTRQCQKSLQEAEQKVRILLANNETAELEPFTDE